MDLSEGPVFEQLLSGHAERFQFALCTFDSKYFAEQSVHQLYPL